jgi:[ribosomal protein S18]-alanine N-acetyltransferase
MGLTYFKRYRMEIDLERTGWVASELPPGYSVLPWDESHFQAHVQAMYRAFASEVDAFVFPSLASREGCSRLMREITGRGEFIPEATWLLQYQPSDSAAPVPCGTIQGVRKDNGSGALQNVGVLAEHRGLGLGALLLRQSLAGFRRVGITRVSLEVTARNQAAHRLYRRLGFLRIRTVYKTAQVAFA